MTWNKEFPLELPKPSPRHTRQETPSGKMKLHPLFLAFLIFTFAGYETVQGAETQNPKRALPSKSANAAPASPSSTSKPSEKEARAFLTALPISNVAIGLFTNPKTIAGGAIPKPATIFSLKFMKVVQKVPDGFLLRWNPPGESEQGELVFLGTDLALREDAWFLDGNYWAVFFGPYKYQATNGFMRTIYGFVLLTPTPTPQPQDLSSVDAEVVYALMAKFPAVGRTESK